VSSWPKCYGVMAELCDAAVAPGAFMAPCCGAECKGVGQMMSNALCRHPFPAPFAPCENYKLHPWKERPSSSPGPKGKLLGSREFSFSVQLNTRCMTNGGQKAGKAPRARENPLKFSIYSRRISSLVLHKDIHNSQGYRDSYPDCRARLIGSLSPPSKYLINRRFVH